MRKFSGFFWLPVAGAIVFNLVFWREQFGVNMVIFDLFILGATRCLYDFQSAGSVMKWLIAANLFCVTMVVLQNSDSSLMGAWISLILVVIFAQFKHRSPIHAIGNGALNFLFFIPTYIEKLKSIKILKIYPARYRRGVVLMFIPVVLGCLFLVIYLSSNSDFSNVLGKAIASFDPVFNWIGSLLDFGRLMFLFFGFYVAGSLLLRNKSTEMSKQDSSSTDILVRNKKTKQKSIYSFFDFGKKDILGLKNLNTTGLMSLAVLNLLLLAMNIVDIVYLWFGARVTAYNELSKNLHDGTNALIFSILLAMSVIMIFFQGNLNFYKKNAWFKRAAYAWIAQNSFLAFSLFLRDYYYISNSGLTSKRIGIMYFLVFVLIGLITVFVKIRFTRSFYYVFRVNAWAVVSVLVISSMISWDQHIVNYNLSHRSKVPVDWDLLLSLSDYTLPALEKQREELRAADKRAILQDSSGAYHSYEKALDRREINFNELQKKRSWLSWNYTDFQTVRKLAVK